MSVSAILWLITLMPVVVKVLQVEVGSKRFSLVNTFARLVGLTFWWPEPNVDGFAALKCVHGSGRQLYFKDPFTLAETFIENFELLCSKCSDASPLIDRSNTHNLSELCIQTAPLYGHAFLCQISHLSIIPNH